MLLVDLCDVFIFFFKQKTAYEMRSSDWSSDVCSSDLPPSARRACWNSTTAAPDMRASWWVEVRLCAGWPKNGTYTLSPRLGSWSGEYHSRPPRLRSFTAPRPHCLGNIAAASPPGPRRTTHAHPSHECGRRLIDKGKRSTSGRLGAS